jgi:Beta-galactosidase/Beta-galactosidase trimerisation domain
MRNSIVAQKTPVLLIFLLGLFVGTGNFASAAGLPEIKNKKVAIFYDKDFPRNHLPRSLDWFKTELKKLNITPVILDAKKVSDPKVVNKKNFDTLIIPFNDIPFEAEYSLFAFLKQGGCVVIPSPVPASWKFNLKEQKWESKNHTRGWYAPFMLRTLAFKWAKQTTRNKLKLYSSLQPLLNGILPLRIENFKRVSYRPLDRWNLHLAAPGRVGDYDILEAENLENASNILLPVYLQSKRKATDFAVYRYHNTAINGGTMVILGRVGIALLKSDSGNKVLFAALKLGESKLPDEQSRSFYQRLIKLNKAMSDLAEIYVVTIASLRDASLVSYRKNGSKWKNFRNKMVYSENVFAKFIKTKLKLDLLVAGGDIDFQKQDSIRKKMLSEIVAASKKFRLYQRQTATAMSGIKASVKPEIKHPLKEFGVVSYRTFPTHLYMFREWHFQNLKKLGLKSTGVRMHQWYDDDKQVRRQLKDFRKDFGFEYSFGRLIPKSGKLNLSNGTVKDSAPQKLDYAGLENRFKKKISRWKGRSLLKISTASENGLGNHYWGSQARAEYQQYLKKQYATIAKLNAHWKTKYKKFKDIKLLTQQPVSPSEHCNWEHWRTFREMKYNTFLKFCYDTFKKHAPDLLVSHTITTGRISSPISGINYYNVSKYQDISGIDGTAVEPPKEWIYLDLTTKPVMTCEWGGLYGPPADSMKGVKYMIGKLWEEVSGGSVGVNFWTWSFGSFPANYVDITGLPTTYGWHGKQLISDFRKIEHILLDGKRKRPEIGILYSSTTRGHDQGWGGRGTQASSNHLQAVINYYDYFLSFHRSVRVVPEEAIMENKDLSYLKLLILPQTEYLSDALQQKLIKYVKQGGNLFIEGRGGKFDNFGNSLNLIFNEAEIVPTFTKERNIILNGKKYFLPGKNDDFVPMPVSSSSKTLAIYADKQPALVSVPLGKGKVVIAGFAGGLRKAACLKKVINAVWKDLGIKQKYTCSNPRILFREWTYKGADFLMCTSRAAQTPLEVVQIKLRGDYKVQDYLFGKTIPVTFDGQYTTFSTLFANGGRVFKLIRQEKTAKVAEPMLKTAKSVPQRLTRKNTKKKSLPYTGLVYRDKPLNIDGYIFQPVIVASGRDLNTGEAYLEVRKGKQKRKKRLIAGKNYYFNFKGRSFLVKSKNHHFVFPMGVNVTIENTRQTGPASACSITRNKNILTLTNGMLRIKIDTAKGGRIVELCLTDDQVNQVTSNGPTNAMSEYSISFPGVFIDRKFRSSILKNSPAEIQVQLAMPNPANGLLLKKILTIKKGESMLKMRSMCFNYSRTNVATPTGLNFHAELNIGGRADSQDLFIIPKVARAAYSPSHGGHRYKNPKQDWAACVDTVEKLAYINNFSLDQVRTVYTWMDQQFYTLELFARKKVTGYGKSVDLDNNLYLLRGVSGIDSFNAGLAVHAVLSPKIDQSKAITFPLEIGSASETMQAVKISTSLLYNGQKIMDIATASGAVSFDYPLEKNFIFNAANLKDGKYEVKIQIAGKKAVTLKKKITLIGIRKKKNLQYYNKFKDNLLKLRKLKGKVKKAEIFKTFVLLEEFRSAVENDNTNEIAAKTRQLKSQMDLVKK